MTNWKSQLLPKSAKMSAPVLPLRRFASLCSRLGGWKRLIPGFPASSLAPSRPFFTQQSRWFYKISNWVMSLLWLEFLNVLCWAIRPQASMFFMLLSFQSLIHGPLPGASSQFVMRSAWNSHLLNICRAGQVPTRDFFTVSSFLTILYPISSFLLLSTMDFFFHA